MSAPRPYGSQGFRYHSHGWSALPAGSRPKPLDKDPYPVGFTGAEGKRPDDDQVAEWVKTRGGYNIAVRLPDNVVGLDVDAWKGSEEVETMKAITDAHGLLPRTWVTTSRSDSSGIRLFRLPEGVDATKLAGNINHPTDPDQTAGEVIKFNHRVAMVWPSVHPDTGNEYHWLDQTTGEIVTDGTLPKPDDLPELPAEWIDHLAGECSCYPTGYDWAKIKATSGDPVADCFDRWHSKLVSGTYSRHEAALRGVMGLLSLQQWPGADEYIRKLEDAFLAAVTADKSRTDVEARSEWDRMVQGAEAKVTPVPYEDRTPMATQAVAADLPDNFWTARPVLAHIQQAAFSRGRSPDAVLVGALARIAADTPHTVRLPAIVGAPCGLTLITAVSGPPGTGKSTAAAIASELIPPKVLKPECDGVPPGSGEGFIELLFDWVTEPDPDTGKKLRVHRQTRNNAYMYVDEGEVLAKLAGRSSGSTLLPYLRTAFTSGVLGNANASQDRKRIIPAGQAVYGVVLGIQPGLAGSLFDEAGAGTPQRILWASTTSPTPPPGDRPDWPGPLERLEIPQLVWKAHERLAGYIHHEIEVPDPIRVEVAERDHHRQQHGADHLGEHQDLIQLKVAACLAILEGRLDIKSEDWQLAAEVTTTSKQVRDGLSAHLQTEAAEREAATARKLAGRQVEAVARTQEWLIVDTAKFITGKVRQKPGEYTPGGLRKTTSRKRREVFEEAFDHSVSEGWIVEKVEPGERGGDKHRLHPGKETP